MRPAAVFDLDGTLIRGTSAERLLVPFLLRRGVLGPRQLGAAFATAAMLPVVGRTAALRRNKRYLAGLDVDSIREHVQDFLSEVLESRFSRPVVGRLVELRERGYVVCLLTGAPDFLAEAVRRRFEMRDGLGSALEVRGGRYTGRLSGLHYYGAVKKRGVRELARRHQVDLTRSFAFADDAADVPFLDCFGHPVAVEPHPALRRVAQRRGWEVVTGG